MVAERGRRNFQWLNKDIKPIRSGIISNDDWLIPQLCERKSNKSDFEEGMDP